MSYVFSLCRMFIPTFMNGSLIAAICLVSGCGSPGEIQLQGEPAAAKVALSGALEAWKTEQPPSEAQTDKPLVWTDEDWKAGRKLSAFQLVNEPERNGGHWRVYADLTFAGKGKKAAPTRVCYAVTLGNPQSIIRSDFLN